MQRRRLPAIVWRLAPWAALVAAAGFALHRLMAAALLTLACVSVASLGLRREARAGRQAAASLVAALPIGLGLGLFAFLLGVDQGLYTPGRALAHVAILMLTFAAAALGTTTPAARRHAEGAFLLAVTFVLGGFALEGVDRLLARPLPPATDGQVQMFLADSASCGEVAVDAYFDAGDLGHSPLLPASATYEIRHTPIDGGVCPWALLLWGDARLSQWSEVVEIGDRNHTITGYTAGPGYQMWSGILARGGDVTIEGEAVTAYAITSAAQENGQLPAFVVGLPGQAVGVNERLREVLGEVSYRPDLEFEVYAGTLQPHQRIEVADPPSQEARVLRWSGEFHLRPEWVTADVDAEERVQTGVFFFAALLGVAASTLVAAIQVLVRGSR